MKFVRSLLTASTFAVMLSVSAFAQTAGFQLPSGTVYVAPMIVSGGIPALTSCGTSPTLATGSNNTMGRITLGSGGATGCTITFSAAYVTRPVCFLNDETGTRASSTAVSTTTTLVVAGLTAADTFNYFCLALPGG